MKRNILVVVLLATLVLIGSASYATSIMGKTSNTTNTTNTPNSNRISAHSFSGIWTTDSSLIFAAVVDDSGINGTVTDASTQMPLQDATVTVGNISSTIASVSTDADGHFEISIANGNYTVMAAKTGYVNQSQTAVVMTNQTATVNFALIKVVEQMGWIVGIVTDANASMPLTGANVTAAEFSATTNSTGHYIMQVTAMKTYNVTAEKTGYEDKTVANVTVAANQTTPLNFALARIVTPPPPTKGWITGTVKDANSSMPLQGVNITANGFSVVTNSSGHYRLEVSAPNTYKVMAEKMGYVTKTINNVTVATNQTVTVDFTLTRTPTPPPPKTIQAKIKIEPRALNLRSHGKWITVEIKLPKNFSVSNINVSSIRLNGTIPVAANAPMHGKDNKLIVKFDRQSVQDLILSKGQNTRFAKVTLTITGDMKNGTTFSGSQTIKTILPMPKPHHEKHGKH